MQSVITATHMDDLSTAMKLLLQELRKRPSNLKRNHFPVYRDLLFLAFSCIPPAQLNLSKFDGIIELLLQSLFYMILF